MGAVFLLTLLAIVAFVMLPVLLQAQMPGPSHTESSTCACGPLIDMAVAWIFVAYACSMFWGLIFGGPHG